MTIEEAENITALYHKLGKLSQQISYFHKLRKAEETGLNPDTPGAANYMQSVVKDHWSIFKDTFKAYFIEQLDKAIEATEKEFSETEKELNEI